jgi:hypothetical protein
MSVSLTPITGLTTLPAVIEYDLFPEVVYGDMVPDIYADFGYPYTGVPSFLKPYVDPAGYISGPQKYEYRYQNQNGIDVVVRGTYDHIMSIIDVLNTYPPRIRDTGRDTGRDKDETQYLDILDLKSKGPSRPKSVPSVGIITKGDFIHAKVGGITFSGSGTLLIVLGGDKNISNAKIILFRSKKDPKEYAELGGRLDKLKSGENADENILFNNAKRESLEESMRLFNISKQSDSYVDIESMGTYYRVYIYAFVSEDHTSLQKYYNYNKNVVYREHSPSFSDVNRETDDLQLFDYNAFIGTNSVYKKTDGGGNLKVKDRTINVLAAISKSDMANIINSNLSVARYNKSNLFHTITIQ